MRTGLELKKVINLIRAVRGAITVDNNTIQDIHDAVCLLLKKIIETNDIATKDIVSCVFTMTNDLDAAYPAKFAREKFDFSLVPMICYQELDIKGSLRKCLRILLTYNCEKEQNEIKHIYLKGAKTLRPDLGKEL